MANDMEKFENEVKRLAKIINVPEESLPIFENGQGCARFRIEVESNVYHYVILGREQELERRSTSNPDELKYWIFEKITFGMALNYEMKNRIEGQDCRRLIWQTQLELLEKLDSFWKVKKESEVQEILAVNPYDDKSSIRASLSKELRYKGHPSKKAWKLAYEKYPLL